MVLTRMFCIYHNKFEKRDDNKDFVFFGVNEVFEKTEGVLEYKLDKYNPFMQKRGFMETSAYMHVYWNKLHEKADMVGFSQYDMKHNQSYENLTTSSIYILNTGQPIVNGGVWTPLMFSHLFNIDFLLSSYNSFFSTKYSLNDLEGQPLSLFQTNIYPNIIYEKLCSWLEVLIDEIYPWSVELPRETHWGVIGGFTERAMGIFNAIEIFNGVNFINLDIEHITINENFARIQYDKNMFLNKYSPDVYTKYISDVTGRHDDAYFSMFKARCYLEGELYECERVCKNEKNGLYFNKNSIRECGFDIEAEDPRIFILNDEVYVAFICLSPYEGQERCIGLTKFSEWKPIFLQLKNTIKNRIEKNWAPFVKNGVLHFVYNYDPLVILSYDLNPEGICDIVFKQENCSLPLNTECTYLRGSSNLIDYKDGYFIGACHSRIQRHHFEHYTHIILIDTNSWKLVYVSKPVMYYYSGDEGMPAWSWSPPHKYIKPLDTYCSILTDKTPDLIQDPVSLYTYNEKYYITINIRNSVTLLYEISFDSIFKLIKSHNEIGYWDNLTKEFAFNV